MGPFHRGVLRISEVAVLAIRVALCLPQRHRNGQRSYARAKGGASIPASVCPSRVGNYFATLGVDAAFGRTLSDDDNRVNAQPVAVVSYGYWKRHLNADRSAVGQVTILNALPVTIVGVAPAEFFGERVRGARS